MSKDKSDRLDARSCELSRAKRTIQLGMELLEREVDRDEADRLKQIASEDAGQAQRMRESIL